MLAVDSILGYFAHFTSDRTHKDQEDFFAIHEVILYVLIYNVYDLVSRIVFLLYSIHVVKNKGYKVNYLGTI